MKPDELTKEIKAKGYMSIVNGDGRPKGACELKREMCGVMLASWPRLGQVGAQ